MTRARPALPPAVPARAPAGRTQARRARSHHEVDARLERYAADLATFDERVLALARRWNAREVALEARTPRDWRLPLDERQAAPRTPTEAFRRDVASIAPLSRDQEVRLARRIELARRLLAGALAGTPWTVADLERHAAHACLRATAAGPDAGALPALARRRWSELHAMRLELVERHLHLVLVVADRYRSLESFLDLVQEGSTALFRAVDHFDWRRGLLFRTYATHWIRQAFRNYLYYFGTAVRVPVYVRKAMKRVGGAIDALGPHATRDEIAARAGLEADLVERALDAGRRTMSLDQPLGGEDESAALGDVVEADTPRDMYRPEMEEIPLGERLERAMAQLMDRERYIVERRFGIGHERAQTLHELAGELGVSIERVRQIQSRAIQKMRGPETRRALEPFLA